MGLRNSKEKKYESNKNVPPPRLNITIPTQKDIGKIHYDWSRDEIQSQLPTDIVLITVNDHEFNSCYSYMRQVKQSWCDSVGMVNFGVFEDEFGKEGVRVTLIRSEDGPVSASLVVRNATGILYPKVVLFVGCCATINPAKARFGDVLIPSKLATYSRKKTTADGKKELHGVKVDISRAMSRLIMSAGDGWVPPLKDQSQGQCDFTVHREAVILSGPEEVDNLERCEELQKSFPDALGLEMEGEGLYAAARDVGVEWAVIKGISDFADGTKTATNEEWRLFSSAMAASVVHNMFKHPDVIQNWPRYQKSVQEIMSSEDNNKNKNPKKGHFGLRNLPSDMVQRSSEVDKVLRLLKTEKNNVCVVGIRRGGDVIGIRGMGGIGKTVLAQAVAWGESNNARQVIWLDIGQTPDCLALINTLVKALGGTVFSSLSEAKEWVR